MLALKSDETADQFTTAFVGASASSDISGSVSVLHGAEFSSYRPDDRFYRVGSLTTLQQLRYHLVEYPWLIVLFTFLLGMAVVPWIRARLDQRTKERLQVHQ